MRARMRGSECANQYDRLALWSVEQYFSATGKARLPHMPPMINPGTGREYQEDYFVLL